MSTYTQVISAGGLTLVLMMLIAAVTKRGLRIRRGEINFLPPRYPSLDRDPSQPEVSKQPEPIGRS